ncbi:hypothetical protein [uncultured Flavobacterium sp.]|uniref:hypothetical protein n=1 Tax=uncultured Flavobacterium sp. TaxID=165435 RepID=UPI002930AE97|nr:hypothetical protein [uncultured Flavobacterium sp.]
MIIKYKILYIIIVLNSILFFQKKTIQNCSSTSLISNKYSNNSIKIENDSISGTYVLESCENSRFKIVINKKKNQFFYTIFDKKKSISKGKAIITKHEGYVSIMLGLIGGIYSEGNIQIQNYGNAMNEFIHFTQCDEKYLTFLKKS